MTRTFTNSSAASGHMIQMETHDQILHCHCWKFWSCETDISHIINFIQCLRSGSVGSARFWLPGSGSGSASKLIGSYALILSITKEKLLNSNYSRNVPKLFKTPLGYRNCPIKCVFVGDLLKSFISIPHLIYISFV